MADKEAAPKYIEVIIISSSPDICLSPDKPCPYQIVAYFSDAQLFSTNVNLTICPATTMLTRITRVYGDEPGSGGGVTSHVNLGYCRPIAAASSTVRVNSQSLLRHDTEFEMNCAGPEGPGNTIGKAIYMASACMSSIAPDGAIQGDTDPPPGEEEDVPWYKKVGRGLAWGANQAKGAVVGVAKGGWEVVQFAGATAQYGTDFVLGPATEGVFGLFGASPPAWLPSGSRYMQSTQTIGQVSQAIWNDPGLVWEGLKAPFVEAWAKGEYGEAIGRGAFDIFGLKGLGKISGISKMLGKLENAGHFEDVFKVLKRADTVLPDEFASQADELLNLGRTEGKLNELVDGARQAGALDDLLKLGKLTPEEIDALVKAGKLTPEEAVLAKASAATDGAIVVRKAKPPHYTPTGPLKNKRVGHTFEKHGSHNTHELQLQAKNSGMPQGQWMDDAAAEDFIASKLPELTNGAKTFDLPPGLGQQINPDGSMISANKATLVPSGSGVKTAFPLFE